MADCDLGYYMSKCEASSEGNRGHKFSAKRAKNCVLDTFRDAVRDEVTEMLTDEEVEAEAIRQFDSKYAVELAPDPGEFTSEFEWHDWLRLHARNILGPHWMEKIKDVCEIDLRRDAHLIGLKMAMKQVKDRTTESS